MHVGGIHLVFGLLFLTLSIFIASLTVYGGYIIVVILQRVLVPFRIVYLRINNWVNSLTSAPDKSVAVSLLPWGNRSFYLKSLSVLAVIFVISYGWQRERWMGDDNSHYVAKEYWVAGQPLNGFRYTLARVLHADNPLTRHLTFLQQVIYDRGASFLPDGDGEIGVWKVLWFYRPYIERLERTYGDDHKKMTSPRMIHFLDDVWETLEILSTRVIQDSSMEKIYFERFAFVASYYDLFNGHYMGVFSGSRPKILKDDFYSKRLITLLRWLDELKVKWEKINYDETLWREQPDLVAIYVKVSISIKQQLISYLAFSRTFSCGDPIISDLYQQYSDLMSDDPTKNIALRLSCVNKKMASKIYYESIYKMRGELAIYVMEEVCHYELPRESCRLIKFYLVPSSTDVRSYAEEISLITTLVNGK